LTAVLSWLPRTRRILLFLILLLSSTQLGLHFWPSSSLVYGIRVDYLSPTIYFLDFLMMFYLLLNRLTDLWLYSAQYFVVVLLSNLVFSANPLATLSWSLHFFLYAIFVASIKFENLTSPPHFTKHFRQGIWDLGFPLILSSFFQLTLAALQVYLGHSLQGPFYYLGERMVSVGQPAVALSSFMDQVLLRAYGTFGHPNVLAGWLVIVCLIILRLKPKPLVRYILLMIPAIGILLTQSRSAALAFFGLVIPWYLLISLRSRLIYYASLLVLVSFSLSFVSPSRSDLSLTERLDLQRLSLQVTPQYPLFGTGANASIPTYPDTDPSFRLLQPDHNSFTLFISWFGLAGIITIIYLIRIYGFKDLRVYDFFPLIPLLLLDHYLLTSPQGLLILLIYLKVVNYSHVKSHRQ